MADYLAIYLNDHLAGSTVGVELARRLAGRNDPYAEPLRAIAEDIEEDRRTLEQLMARLGVNRDRIKPILGWLGEKMARLKPNGHLLSLSPLSTMEELETLSLGVEGKASLWKALRSAMRDNPKIDVAELDALLERAGSQRERIEELRLRAAAETLLR